MNPAVEYLGLQQRLGTRIDKLVGVTVTINGKAYQGARYEWVGTYEAGMMACQQGEKQAGDEYRCERYYILGVMPKFKRSRTCFAHEGRTLYVSGHYQKNEPHPMQPLGKTFMLGVWPSESEPIDHYERYDRIPILISEES